LAIRLSSFSLSEDENPNFGVFFLERLIIGKSKMNFQGFVMDDFLPHIMKHLLHIFILL
jgi:hypothetical protein